jgi:hypothetical protein
MSESLYTTSPAITKSESSETCYVMGEEGIDYLLKESINEEHLTMYHQDSSESTEEVKLRENPATLYEEDASFLTEVLQTGGKQEDTPLVEVKITHSVQWNERFQRALEVW